MRIDPHADLISKLAAERYRSTGEPKQPLTVVLGSCTAFDEIANPHTGACDLGREGSQWYLGTIDGVALNVEVASVFPKALETATD